MTDDDLRSIAPSVLLEDAATALVDAFSASGGDPNLLTAGVKTLVDRFRGSVTYTQALVNDAAPDPERHLLSWAPNGSPVELESDPNQMYRDDVAGAVVSMTGLQVVLVADLLRELAARLRPGAAFGLGTGGLALVDFTEHLADTLSDLTTVRRPSPPVHDPAQRAEWLARVSFVRQPDLRNAVTHVINSLAATQAAQRAGTLPPTGTWESSAPVRAVESLALVVRDRLPSGVEPGDDPGFFLRSTPGRTLFDEANDLRNLLAAEADSTTEPPMVALNAKTAFTAGLLLKELVARLRPGISYGLLAVRSELGIVAGDLAAELLAQTYFGRPTFYPGPTRMWTTAPDRLRSEGTRTNVLDPVDHLTPPTEVFITSVDPANGDSFEEYEQLREAAVHLCGLLDDETASDHQFAEAARRLHLAIRGPAEQRFEVSGATPDEVAHQVRQAVLLSPAEVAVAADLLDELAARLHPGAAFGPSGEQAQKGDEVTEMAAELRALSDWRRPVVTGTAREPVPTRFGRLRDAAIRWLDIVADGRDGWRIPEDADWRSATVDLYLLAQDRPARTALPLVQDPARHLRRRSGTTTDPQPIELTDEASDIAELLPRNDVEVAPVVVPSSLGVYVGDALVELAGRLRRGGPFGPKPHGDNLARTAAELGRKILAHAVLTYCRSWDYDARRPRDYLSESEAREFDRTGTAYTVVLGEAARPDAIVDVHWAAEELSVSKLDDHGRPHVWWEFQRTSPAMMFLRRMTEYRYNGESTDPLDGGFVDQFNFEPDGTAHRMTWLDDQREWLESTGGGARVESLWTPVPSFGDWTSVRDLERFQPPSDGDMPVHYCLSWDDVHARPQGLILAYEARARDEEGATYGVILGELSDPRILITVSRNDNKFVVNIFDDNKRICTAHMFVRVGDRLLQRQQLRLIYPEPTTRNLREVERIAAYEVRTDGWARATVSEPDSGKLLSERIEQVDIDRYWWPTPQFGDWAWTHTLDPAPKYWVDTELAI